MLLVKRIEFLESETLGNFCVLDSLGVNLFEGVTLELPWLNNQSSISCIPAGIYNCIKVPQTIKIPYVHFEITAVPNRSGICGHILNFNRDSEGCIGFGYDFEDIDHDSILDISKSKKTFEKMMFWLPPSFQIEIQ